MSTLVTGDGDALFAALKEVLRTASARGEVVMVVTLSNACPTPTAENIISCSPGTG